MLNQELINKIHQQRLNALVAIQLHRKRIGTLRKRNLLVEFLSIAVPAFYIVPRFLAKGTAVAYIIDTTGELLAASLLVLAILKVVYKWQDNEIRHAAMSRRNMDTIQEADRLLARQTTNLETVEQFLTRIKEIDAEDDDLIPDDEIKRDERQIAYREAIKRLSPDQKDAVCPVCGANAWFFKVGDCEACGGTQISLKEVNN